MAAWQKLGIKILPELEEHYMHFEPYCNLNIVDLWSYRVGLNHWFKKGDTIVYRLSDYMDDSSYLTVLGEKSARDAIKELCKKYRKQRAITLRSVPEITVKSLGNWKAINSVTEDINYHDYIFNVDSLVNFTTPELKGKYKLYKKLVEHNPKLRVKRLYNKRRYDRELVYKMFKKWVMQTKSSDWHKEFLALRRALSFRNVTLVCLGFFDGRKIIGYTINGPEDNGYYQAFFGKADRNYEGLSIFMESQTARYMNEHFSSKFMNLQPDCGLEGLRQYKTSLGPQRMLKKYIVTINTKKALTG